MASDRGWNPPGFRPRFFFLGRLPDEQWNAIKDLWPGKEGDPGVTAFLASHYCMNIEVAHARRRQSAGEAVIVPIVLDDADLRNQSFMSKQALPTDAKPILSAKHWPDPNDAWRQVADRLRELVAAHAR